MIHNSDVQTDGNIMKIISPEMQTKTASNQGYKACKEMCSISRKWFTCNADKNYSAIH